VLADRDNQDDCEMDDSRRLEQAEGILDRACQVTIYECNVLMYFLTFIIAMCRLEQAGGILDRACQVTIYGCNVLMYFLTYNCYVPLRAGWRDPRSRVSGHCV